MTRRGASSAGASRRVSDGSRAERSPSSAAPETGIPAESPAAWPETSAAPAQPGQGAPKTVTPIVGALLNPIECSFVLDMLMTTRIPVMATPVAAGVLAKLDFGKV